MWKKKLVLVLVALSITIMLVKPGIGEEYPAKPIEVIEPFAAGASTDITCRIIAELAPKYLGQTLFVTNKPGASGSIGTAEVINAPPDGYKLLSAMSTYFITKVRVQKIPFDPGDLIPILSFAEPRDILCVLSDSPWKSYEEVLKYARENPGKFRWGHVGRGAKPHVVVAGMFIKAGVKATDMPYAGSAPLGPALLGGHVDAISGPFGPVNDYIKMGKVRVLAALTDHRYKTAPDAPSLVELGYPELGMFAAKHGFYARKDTPKEILRKLLEAIGNVAKSEEFIKRVEAIGAEPRFDEPETISEIIRKGGEVATPLLKELGLLAVK